MVVQVDGLGTNQQRKFDVRLLHHMHVGYSPATTADQNNVGRVTIDILPDDVLLEIFDFYVVQANVFIPDNRWQTLAHVCRKWRNVIFESPSRLNLQLACSERTPVRETLDVWPLLPIIILHIVHSKYSTFGLDNIVAALEHNDRIRQITLKLFADQQSKSILGAMQEPFPALTTLMLSGDKTAPDIPDSFFGGSAPHLRSPSLDHILFPGLSKFLLSATDLVHLDLWSIPHTGYISPEAMATCLSALTRLNGLRMEFVSPRSHPNRESRRLPQLTRAVLPNLIRLHFKGVSEYLEDLVARIDAPRLKRLEMKFFHQLILDTPQLVQFITRTPNLKACDQARIYFSDLEVIVTFPRTSSDSNNGFNLTISCRQPEWQLSAMAQVCSSSFPPSIIHKVERLYIRKRSTMLKWQDDFEDSQWLELLHPFTGVKYLHLSDEFARFAPSLRELVGGRTTEVLPALQGLFLEKYPSSGPFKEAIGKFVAARRLFNLPVAVYYGDGSNDNVEVRSFG